MKSVAMNSKRACAASCSSPWPSRPWRMTARARGPRACRSKLGPEGRTALYSSLRCLVGSGDEGVADGGELLLLHSAVWPPKCRPALSTRGARGDKRNTRRRRRKTCPRTCLRCQNNRRGRGGAGVVSRECAAELAPLRAAWRAAAAESRRGVFQSAHRGLVRWLVAIPFHGGGVRQAGNGKAGGKTKQKRKNQEKLIVLLCL